MGHVRSQMEGAGVTRGRLRQTPRQRAGADSVDRADVGAVYEEMRGWTANYLDVFARLGKPPAPVEAEDLEFGGDAASQA